MMTVEFWFMSPQEIIFLDIWIKWMQLQFSEQTESELKAALVNVNELVI